MNQTTEFAFGGIVFNEEGEVLMRSPSGFWGGYVWTFAKGGPDPSDRSPEETAIREVLEETGYECSIIAPIPGEFESDMKGRDRDRNALESAIQTMEVMNSAGPSCD